MNHIADNHDALLDYLYEEGDPDERLKIATHLQACAACSVAVLEFQDVRGMLSDWAPPATQLGFRVVQDSQPAPRVTFNSMNRMPWLQAAAAVLLFVSGMAVSQLDVDYQDGELRVRTQPAAPAMPAGNIRNIVLPAQGAGSGAAANVAPIDVDAIDRGRPEPPTSADVERLLQRVRTMIDQSEQRQQHALALRLSQVAREVDTQHQADLLRIQQDFGQQQEATMNYLVRTSGGVK